MGKVIVQLKEVGRGELERRKEFGRQSLETQGTCSSLLPAFPSWIGQLPAEARGRERKDGLQSLLVQSKWSQLRGKREKLPPRTAGLGVFHPLHLPCLHPSIHPDLDGACANKWHMKQVPVCPFTTVA